MKLIINIPEWKYKSICEGIEASKRCGVVGIGPDIHEAIANGTPLPKEHGRLIDVSDIEWAKHREERYYIDYEVIDWDEIVNAPTIVEADKGEEE